MDGTSIRSRHTRMGGREVSSGRDNSPPLSETSDPTGIGLFATICGLFSPSTSPLNNTSRITKGESATIRIAIKPPFHNARGQIPKKSFLAKKNFLLIHPSAAESRYRFRGLRLSLANSPGGEDGCYCCVRIRMRWV